MGAGPWSAEAVIGWDPKVFFRLGALLLFCWYLESS